MYFRNLIWIDSGLAPGAARPLITFESLDGMRNGGAAHKNMEAPRSINNGDTRLRR